jgi:hopanoid-associated phosphorylase
MRLGIVVGLDGEARLARRLGASVLVGISGATAHGASRAAAELVAAGATHLLSFGLAAGLDPSFRAGDVLVPARVVADGTAHDTDPVLRTMLGAGSTAPLLHSDVLVSDRAAKAALWAASGCGSLDMESGAVARAAAAAGLPFAVLRAVCDPAGRTLPPAAGVPLRADGRLQGWAILRSILRRPGQLPALIALGRDAGRATTALSKRLSSLAPGLTKI